MKNSLLQFFPKNFLIRFRYIFVRFAVKIYFLFACKTFHFPFILLQEFCNKQKNRSAQLTLFQTGHSRIAHNASASTDASFGGFGSGPEAAGISGRGGDSNRHPRRGFRLDGRRPETGYPPERSLRQGTQKQVHILNVNLRALNEFSVFNSSLLPFTKNEKRIPINDLVSHRVLTVCLGTECLLMFLGQKCNEITVNLPFTPRIIQLYLLFKKRLAFTQI